MLHCAGTSKQTEATHPSGLSSEQQRRHTLRHDVLYVIKQLARCRRVRRDLLSRPRSLAAAAAAGRVAARELGQRQQRVGGRQLSGDI